MHNVLCLKEGSHSQKDCFIQQVEFKYLSIYFFFRSVINLCCDTDGKSNVASAVMQDFVFADNCSKNTEKKFLVYMVASFWG